MVKRNVLIINDTDHLHMCYCIGMERREMINLKKKNFFANKTYKCIQKFSEY